MEINGDLMGLNTHQLIYASMHRCKRSVSECCEDLWRWKWLLPNLASEPLGVSVSNLPGPAVMAHCNTRMKKAQRNFGWMLKLYMGK
jgi:hypothetical protein